MACEYIDNEHERPLRAKELEKKAIHTAERLRAEGFDITPIIPHGKNMAVHFWGKTWMRHLAESDIYGTSMPKGRTLLRHGCVLHINVEGNRMSALVIERELYEVDIEIAPIQGDQLEQLRQACSQHAGSWLALLEGHINDEVLSFVCSPESGLLPHYKDWHISCTCPDWADICPHAASVLYGLGTMLDDHPGLLFSMRSISPHDLIPKAEAIAPSTLPPHIDLASVFNIDLDL